MSATGRSEAAETGYVRHPDDDFSTPDWATLAILPFLPMDIPIIEPSAGSGAILRAIKKWRRVDPLTGFCTPAASVTAIEVDMERAEIARVHGYRVMTTDFLVWARSGPPVDQRTLIITNPPYKLAMEFVEASLRLIGGHDYKSMSPRVGIVAMLLRINWMASQGRAEFHRMNPSDVYVLPKRPSFTGNGKTDATEYAWYLWGPGMGGRWSVLRIGD
jgi:hypothetical protein